MDYAYKNDDNIQYLDTVLNLQSLSDEVAEWLRRWTANPMGSARVGSNPIFVVKFFSLFKTKKKLFHFSKYNGPSQTTQPNNSP